MEEVKEKINKLGSEEQIGNIGENRRISKKEKIRKNGRIIKRKISKKKKKRKKEYEKKKRKRKLRKKEI